MKKNSNNILSMMKFCEPMARHTTFRIGGPVDIWAQPQDNQSLNEIIDLCRQDGIPFYVVGNGSNLLVKDQGIKGCVINFNTDSFKTIKTEDVYVTVGAGCELARLLNVLSENGLCGLEFLAGIPATVGGALAMNAGWTKAQIGDFVEEVTVMDNKGCLLTLQKKEIIFAYRNCSLDKYIILSAKLKLEKSSKNEVSDRIKKYITEKRIKQELDKPSAGCIFKNPTGDSAGRLIDVSGLKGAAVGGAMVSNKHANFIINNGNATCKDVLNLIEVVRDKVKKDHGIHLEEEIKIFKPNKE